MPNKSAFCLKFLPLLALWLAVNPALAGPAPGKSQSLTRPDQVPDGLAKTDWSSIRAAYEAGRHSFQPTATGWQARNPGQQWTTQFDRRGFLAAPRDGGWTWGLELQSYGFPGAERAIHGVPAVQAAGQRLTYQWDGTVQEWFVNDPRGLEHGFTVARRPDLREVLDCGSPLPLSEADTQAGPKRQRTGAVQDAGATSAPLTFLLAPRGSLTPAITEDAKGVLFRDAAGATVLNYTGLKVWDADGKVLPSRFELADAQPSTPNAQPAVRLLVEERGARYPLTIDPIAQQAYLKSHNNAANPSDGFGYSVAVSGDTVVVGAWQEDSGTTGVNSTPDESALDAGAAYVFVRSGGTWSQQAYLKPAAVGTTQANDYFGCSVAVSGDTVVVGAYKEDSGTTGVNSTAIEGALDAGAAYVFVRSGGTWSQQAYLKPAAVGTTQAGDNFGYTVAVSGDTVIVGAYSEDSNTTGVNSTANEGAGGSASGAAYVFVRSAGAWSQQAYLKASQVSVSDMFGTSVAVSGDTVVVGAWQEDSGTTGVNSTPDESAIEAGAAYVFVRSGTTWSQEAYLKPAAVGTTQAGDNFGRSVAVSGDTVVVGAVLEDSSATGVNSTPNESASASGAAYVFVRSGGTWSQQAYLKAHQVTLSDYFGQSVAVSGDTVVVGAYFEDSSTTGVNSTPNESGSSAGAAYVFVRSGGTWSQQAYLKPAAVGTTQASDNFGGSVAVSGDTVVVGAVSEDSSTTGMDSTPTETAPGAGAAYMFMRSGTNWSQQAYAKASNTPPIVGTSDSFGYSMAVSGDTVVVGVPFEDSSTTGVDSTPNELAASAGAAYVFVRSGGAWTQQAYLKASNAGAGDNFGYRVAVSGDTVVVGAVSEASSTMGVNSTPNELAVSAGAAYVFVRSGGTWTQQAYFKASNAGAGDGFGYSVAVSGDTVIVGANSEGSSTTGVNSTPNESASTAGAAYVFVRSGGTWSQQAYLKAHQVTAGDRFGWSVSVSGDTVVVGAYSEDSSTTGMNSAANESASASGAAYVFVRSGTTWSQQAYLKAHQVTAGDSFGWSVSVSGDTVVVGASNEDSGTTGVDSTPNESALDAGAAYVFVRSGTNWSQQAYLKAHQVTLSDSFGWSVAVSGDTVVVGAVNEDSSTMGVGSTPTESSSGSGAAYVFVRSETTWSQQAYLKAHQVTANDGFGFSVSVSGDTVVVGAPNEDSSTTGVGSTANEISPDSGAAYIFTGLGLPAEITVRGNGVPIPDGTSTPSLADHTDFDGAPLTGATGVRTFTIQNTGTNALTLSGMPLVAVSGPHAADFTVTALPASPVAFDGSTTFQVTFDPSALGTRTATLTIANDDSDEGTFDFAIQGTGLPPEITSVNGPSAGSFRAGQNLNFTVNFNAAVTVNTAGGTPYLSVALDTGGTVQAAYLSGSGTSALVFAYTVQTGNNDANGIALGSAIILNGGTIQDGSSIDAVLTLNSVASTAGVLVDTTSPTVTISAPSASSTGTGPITYTVTYADAAFSASTLAVGNITLNTTGTASGTVAVTGSGTTRTVTLSGITGSGTLGISIAAGTASDLAGNLAPASSASGTFTVTPPNTTPTVAVAIPDFSVNEDAANVVTNLTAIFADLETGARNLTYSVQANNNPALLTASITAGTNLTLAFTANASGSSTLTVRATDGGSLFVEDTFVVTVTPVNDAPTLAAITDPAAVLEDASAQTVNLIGLNAGGGESQGLTVTATSSNPGLIPNPTVTYTSPAATGSLSYTPVANASGTAVITVTVADDGGTDNGGVDTSAAQTFTITVTAVNDAPGFIVGGVPGLELVGWGWNNYGQATAPEGLSGVVRVAGGAGFTVALKNDGTVVAWGRNDYGQTDVPAGLSGVVKIASGYGHTLALKNDGAVVAWGRNANGQLDVPADLSGVIAIAAGESHSVALKSNGTVVAWGGNFYGETVVPADLAGVIAIAAGNDSTMVLKNDGTLEGWGYNGSGQTTVPTGLSGVVAIAAGEYHYLALKSDGTVVVIEGYNNYGLQEVPAGLSGVVAIAAGQSHDVALKSDGTVVAWGRSGDGQTTVPAGLSGVASIAAGDDYTLALKTVVVAPPTAPVITVAEDSGSYAGGAAFARAIVPGPADESAQTLTFTLLNDNNALFSAQPAIDASGTLTFTPAANAHGSAMVTVTAQDNGGTANGGVDTGAAQIFTITVGAVNDAPVVVLAITDLVVNEDAAIAVTNLTLHFSDVETPAAALTYAIVENTNSALVGATLTQGTNLTLAFVVNGNGVSQISVSATDAGGLSVTNTFMITVNPVNDLPVLAAIPNQITLEDTAMTLTLTAGDADGEVVEFYVDVASGNVSATVDAAGQVTVTPAPHWNGEAVIEVVAYNNAGEESADMDNKTFTLTVTAVNDAPMIRPGVVGWGDNGSGEATVLAGLTGVAAVAAGEYHTVALKSDGTVVAWGGDDYGETAVPAGLTGVAAIATGQTFTMALITNGTVVAWGDNGQGQTNVPVDLTGVTAIAAGDRHAVALKTNGTVVAWGGDWAGQATVLTGLTGVTAVAAGASHTVALKSDGTMVAWGSDWAGQATVPAGLTGVTAVAAGASHTVALKSDGTVVAWGHDGDGQTNVPVDLAGVSAIAAGFYHTVALKSNGTVVAWGGDWAGQATVPAGLTGVTAVAAGASHTVTLRAVMVVDGAVVTVVEDSATHTRTGFASDIVPGPEDESAQTLTFTLSNDNNALFSAQPAIDASGTLTFTPAANAHGSAMVTVTAQDNGGTANGGVDTGAAKTFTITVGAVNDAPVLATVGDQATLEDTAKVLTLSATDIESNTLTYSAVVDSGSVTAMVSGATLTLTPAADWNGTASITVTVTDSGSGNLTDSETFNLAVTPVNDAPVATAQSVTTAEDEARAITLAGTDEEGGALTYTVATSPTNGTLSGTAPSLTYTPNTNYHGGDSFTFTVDDGTVVSAVAAVTLTVTPVNDAPVLAALSNRAVHVGESLLFNAVATDDDLPLNALNFTLETGAPDSAGISSGGAFSWTPTLGDLGSRTIGVRVTDDGQPALHDVKSFEVQVVRAPMITRITQDGTNVTLTWTAVDGRNYRLGYADDIVGAWFDLPGDVTATGTTAEKTDVRTGGRRFYRLQVLP